MLPPAAAELREFPAAYSLILPLVASCIVTRDLLRLAPDFLIGLRSVCRAAYVGCQPDYKHAGNHLAGREPAASLRTGRCGKIMLPLLHNHSYAIIDTGKRMYCRL